MAGHACEVFVRAEERELVPDAERSEEGVDRSDLHTAPPAAISDLGSSDVIGPVGNEKRECGEALDDAIALARTQEALKQLLQDETGRKERLTGTQSRCQRSDVHRVGAFGVAAQRSRPDAGVDEDAHRRERSAL